MTHVKTSPYMTRALASGNFSRARWRMISTSIGQRPYPQSNGKIERWHKSIKAECIRPGVPLSLGGCAADRGLWVTHYNTVRLHSAIGAPLHKLEGRETQIFAERDRKLEAARQQRQRRRNINAAAPSGLESAATVN
jgi:transposase InsO family protein